MKRHPSLKQRLLLAGALGLLLLVLLSSVLLGAVFERATGNRLDRELDRSALDVIARLEVGADGKPHLAVTAEEGRYHRVFSGDYWQLNDNTGTVLLQSRSLWDQTLSVPTHSTLPATGLTFQDITGPLDQRLRVRIQPIMLPKARTPMTLLVASDRSALDAEATRFRWYVALAIALLAALWLLVLLSQVTFAIRPLRALGARVEAVRRGESSRIATEDLSGDIAPLANELNTLLDHHQRMVQRARSSAQDLAHALKTPLAILGAEAAGNGAQWRDTVRAQSRRMQASVDRYLASGLATDANQQTTLLPVAEALCALMQRLHGPRGAVFTNAISDNTLSFAGDSSDLEEMLGNLLDNAGKWASNNVTLDARREDGKLLVSISDDGPGLPEEALEQVLQRGVRLDQRASSTGLGLAIVNDIATSYGGSLELSNGARGLRATLRLPAR